MRRRHLPALAAGLLATPAFAQTAPWPGRGQVRIVLPFPPAGFSDSVSRVMLPGLGAGIGQTVVIDNRPGAGGTVGTDHVAKSPADGYTLCISHASPHGIAPGVYPQLPYDPIADFSHFVLVCETPTALMVRRDSPITSFAQYLDTARKQGLRWGTSGVGSIGHLQGEVLAKAAGVRMDHVPYRGTAPALQDLLAGVIESIFEPIAGLTPQMVATGPLRPLAISTPQRIAALPDVPSVVELGFPQVSATAWMGLSGPKGIPAPIAETMTRVALEVMQQPDVKARMTELAVFPPAKPVTGEAYAGFIRDYMTKWAGIAKASNIVAS